MMTARRAAAVLVAELAAVVGVVWAGWSLIWRRAGRAR